MFVYLSSNPYGGKSYLEVKIVYFNIMTPTFTATLFDSPPNISLKICLCFNLKPELPTNRGEDLQSKCLVELYGLKVK